MTNNEWEANTAIDVVTAHKLEQASVRGKFSLCLDCLKVLREQIEWLHALYVSEEGHIYPAQIVEVELANNKYAWDYAWAKNTLCGKSQRLLGQSAWFICSADILQNNEGFIRYLVEHDNSLLHTPLNKQTLPEDTLAKAIMLYKLATDGESK